MYLHFRNIYYGVFIFFLKSLFGLFGLRKTEKTEKDIQEIFSWECDFYILCITKTKNVQFWEKPYFYYKMNIKLSVYFW